MSNEVYPALPGLAYGVRRRPMWSTDVRTTPTQREYRSSDQIYPRYRLQLAYEYLRSGALSEQHLETLEGFFNRHHGALESFLLDDPDDSTVADQFFGVGDGTTTAYQLVRTRGGFVQPIDQASGTPLLTLSDWQGDRVRLHPAARTNYLQRSDAFNHAYWTRQGGGTTANADPGPSGASTAELFAENSSTTQHMVRATLALSPAQPLAFVFWVKAKERTVFRLMLQNAAFTSGARQNFNLATGQVGASTVNGNGEILSASISPAGNGYFRCELVAQADTVGDTTTLASGLMMLADNNTEPYLGDGVSGIYLGCAMVSPGLFGGRYIPTGAAAVTVPADYAISATGLATLSAAPEAGAQLRWSGSYYWRARFEQDELDFEKFLDGLWKNGRVDLITTRS